MSGLDARGRRVSADETNGKNDVSPEQYWMSTEEPEQRQRGKSRDALNRENRRGMPDSVTM